MCGVASTIKTTKKKDSAETQTNEVVNPVTIFFVPNSTIDFFHKYFPFSNENDALNKIHVNVKIDNCQFIY
jgi:hypothetical protein